MKFMEIITIIGVIGFVIFIFGAMTFAVIIGMGHLRDSFECSKQGYDMYKSGDLFSRNTTIICEYFNEETNDIEYIKINRNKKK